MLPSFTGGFAPGGSLEGTYAHLANADEQTVREVKLLIDIGTKIETAVYLDARAFPAGNNNLRVRMKLGVDWIEVASLTTTTVGAAEQVISTLGPFKVDRDFRITIESAAVDFDVPWWLLWSRL